MYLHLFLYIIGDNRLSGTIPSGLGLLTNVEVIILADNLLSGSIPSELALLINVEEISLADNLLSGSIPSELGLLTNVEVIIFDHNNLSGSIPSELGLLTNLEEIVLYSNNLSGSIPSELGLLTNLEEIILYRNNLSGSIPSELGLLTNLEGVVLRKYGCRVDLCLEENGLNPSSTSTFAFFLLLHHALILDDNNLSGSIPSELGLLTNCMWLFLGKYGHKVDLCLEEHGWNPSSTFNFAFFPLLHDVLILGDNKLSGSIPSELGLLTNVEVIYLSDNDLSGSIPSKLGLLTNVKGIYLSDDDLSGSIPSELGLLTNLFEIDLCTYGCRVDLCLEENGLNPSSTSNFVFFLLLHDGLILDGNQLSGSIPSELGLLTNCGWLVLCKYGRRVDL